MSPALTWWHTTSAPFSPQLFGVVLVHLAFCCTREHQIVCGHVFNVIHIFHGILKSHQVHNLKPHVIDYCGHSFCYDFISFHLHICRSIFMVELAHVFFFGYLSTNCRILNAKTPKKQNKSRKIILSIWFVCVCVFVCS